MKMLFSFRLLLQKTVVQQQHTLYSDSTTNAMSSLGKYRAFAKILKHLHTSEAAP